MVSLPKILTEKQNENTWEWDGWKPKAKANAPDDVKSAIDSFISEVEAEEDDDTIVFQ